MILRSLFNKYNCDKGHKHNYELVYEKDFEKKKYFPVTILEVGVFKGESISAWLEYFPYATVIGLDTFERISPDDINVQDENRVQFIQGDSTSEGIIQKLKDTGLTFDYIIDDGLHTPIANKLTFSNLFQFLKKDGIYYIEDFWPMFIMTEDELSHKFLQKHGNEWNSEYVNEFLNILEKFNYQTIDHRKLTGQPDSYIFRIENI
jgi:hypothetical protein